MTFRYSNHKNGTLKSDRLNACFQFLEPKIGSLKTDRVNGPLEISVCPIHKNVILLPKHVLHVSRSALFDLHTLHAAGDKNRQVKSSLEKCEDFLSWVDTNSWSTKSIAELELRITLRCESKMAGGVDFRLNCSKSENKPVMAEHEYHVISLKSRQGWSSVLGTTFVHLPKEIGLKDRKVEVSILIYGYPQGRVALHQAIIGWDRI